MKINRLTEEQTLADMSDLILQPAYSCLWIPAFAGMTYPEYHGISRTAHIRESKNEFRGQVHKHFFIYLTNVVFFG